MSTFTETHKAMLSESAVLAEVAEAAGARSVAERGDLPESLRRHFAGPGLVFEWHPLTGDPVPQYRPDNPTGDRKYLFPDRAVPLNVIPAHRDRLGSAPVVLIVEGTKQTLAAVTAAPDDVAVIGVAGCWGWSRDGVPDPDLGRLELEGRRVVVAFDADVDTNPDVHLAAERLAAHLDILGASEVGFLRLPAGAKAGLDDYLASLPAGGRQGALCRLLDRQVGPLGRRPRGKALKATEGPERFFDRNGLMAVTLAEQVLDEHHLALAPDGSIWAYDNGVYVDSEPIVSALRDLLGDRYRPMHRKAVEELAVDLLRARGLVLGDRPHPGLVNVANGMLHVESGELGPHDPGLLSTWQLSVRWDPAATCPAFDAWVTDRVGDQAEGLLEAASLVLTPWVAQRRTLFLYGPERSGKSTLARRLERLVGPAATTSVSLHALASNRFSAAALYGKALNVAGDLSDHHVDDLSLYKQVTGDDLVAGERKFRDAFTFHNGAFFVFTANQPPTVGESSGAYLARTWPVLFPKSVTGTEDRHLEDRLDAELEGLLVRLVEAVQRWLARGGYPVVNPLVADDFAQQSDVAALFAAEVLAAEPGGFLPGKDAFDAYTDWAASNGRGRLGRNKFLARLENAHGPRQRRQGDRTGPTGWRDLRVLPADSWRDPDPLARFAFFSPTSPHEEIGEEGVGEAAISREGEVGANRANHARPDSVPATPTTEDPDELTEVQF